MGCYLQVRHHDPPQLIQIGVVRLLFLPTAAATEYFGLCKGLEQQLQVFCTLMTQLTWALYSTIATRLAQETRWTSQPSSLFPSSRMERCLSGPLASLQSTAYCHKRTK